MMLSKMRITCGMAAAVAAMLLGNCSAFGPPTKSISRAQRPLFLQRRDIIDIVARVGVGAAVAGFVGSTQEANALDMDAFESSLIEKDTTQCNPKLDPKCAPKLSPDEALCKYGVPGSDARTAACYRVRDAGGLLPSSRKGERNTAGWVNNPIAL